MSYEIIAFMESKNFDIKYKLESVQPKNKNIRENLDIFLLNEKLRKSLLPERLAGRQVQFGTKSKTLRRA